MPKVSTEHKKALAEGRQQSAAIRAYLNALETEAANRKRGRRRTPDGIRQRIASLEEGMKQEDPLKRLNMIQEQMDLQDELDRIEQVEDPADYEQGFIEAVKPYSERKGITYSAWRKLGVPAATLKKANFSRSM